jgi:Na+/proline symporter
MSAVLSIAIFATVMVAVAIRFRLHPTPNEFFVAGRKAAPVTVGAALFQLIGGGEVVTITALGYTHGFTAISLFLGYSAAFFLLGFLAPRIRSRAELARYNSLPDYIYDHFGTATGRIVAAISIVAFFALMLLQFSAAGQLLAPLIGLSYESAVLLTALIPLVYLAIGGFRTVLVTDLLQGAAMFLLMAFLAGVLLVQRGFVVQASGTVPLPTFSSVSMVLTGFFVALASSDVWQRSLAARSDRAAKIGFLQGGTWLLLAGLLLSWLGIVARHLQVTDSADSAFGALMSNALTPALQGLVALLMFVTIVSTADTEMFLLSSLLQREYGRFRAGLNPENDQLDNINRARGMLIGIAAAGAVVALMWRDLIQVYTWLLSSLLVIAPLVAASLLWKIGPKTALCSVFLNLMLFGILATIGTLTLESAFLIVIPGAITILAGAFVEKGTYVAKAKT